MVAEAAPSADELQSAWANWQTQRTAHATHDLSFSTDTWKTVADGEVARRRDRLDGTDRVVGMIWVPADLDTTWVAVMDPHGSVVEGMVYEVLEGSTPDHRDAFQSIRLPWPLAPRQWVITVENNLPLIGATEGKVWERTWALSDRRDATQAMPKAMWLPVNEGGWYYVPAAQGTLVVYHVRTVVGGLVPDEAAVRWSMSTLSGMLGDVRDRATWVKSHYGPGHAPVLRPGGTPVPPLAHTDQE